MDKSGSNVMEALFDMACLAQQIYIADTFISDPRMLARLSGHCYGNYVVQRLLEIGTAYQQYRVLCLRGAWPIGCRSHCCSTASMSCSTASLPRCRASSPSASPPRMAITRRDMGALCVYTFFRVLSKAGKSVALRK